MFRNQVRGGPAQRVVGTAPAPSAAPVITTFAPASRARAARPRRAPSLLTTNHAPPRSPAQYDTDVVTWSPQGRIFQIEYAMEAVKQGSAAVGLKVRG